MLANRLSHRFVRTLLAAIFGFMSLGHGPIMGFAAPYPTDHHHHQATPPHQHHAIAPADGPSTHDPGGLSDEPAGTPACYSLGCFTAISTLPDYEPKADNLPLTKLAPRPPRDIAQLFQEPADPPPRLQV